MPLHKPLVLDANILIRAVHGVRARRILDTFANSVSMCSPDVCFADAESKIPVIAPGRNLNPEVAFAALYRIAEIVQIVDAEVYGTLQSPALSRIAVRDPDDWPIVATALLLSAPIWTEDQDFFGCGIATWTTDRVEIYLRGE